MSDHEQSGKTSRSSVLNRQIDSSTKAINLVDATRPDEAPSTPRDRSQSPGWKKVARESTKTSLRESMNRRKYARWSQDKYNSERETRSSNEVVATDVDPSHSHIRPTHQKTRSSDVFDFAQSSNPDQSKRRERKRMSKAKQAPEYVVDILYENQRGSFFCGIPLYSHSSLLQFDPAPWVTKDYKESAVNITNAQVPDPSWQWDWKHWYVDMSGDVDEDGWQYSFAFFGNFAWHGTHPWFHSYVRRRRWLRKRVKKESSQPGKPQPSSMSAAHKMNTDYFTIHSKQVGARPFEEMSQINRTDSYMSYHSAVDAEDDIPEDLHDIGSLLTTMRLSSIDREKIDAVKRFVDAGGEELYYLREHIPEIMSRLVYQSSKRQLLEFLRQQANEAQQHRDEHDAESRPEAEAETRRIDNLRSAATAADKQIEGLEYWSDRKGVLQTSDEAHQVQTPKLKTIFDEHVATPQPDTEPASDIKGIAEDAEVGHDATEDIVRQIHKLDSNDDREKNTEDIEEGSGDSKDKGKEKEKEKEKDP